MGHHFIFARQHSPCALHINIPQNNASLYQLQRGEITEETRRRKSEARRRNVLLLGNFTHRQVSTIHKYWIWTVLLCVKGVFPCLNCTSWVHSHPFCKSYNIINNNFHFSPVVSFPLLLPSWPDLPLINMSFLCLKDTFAHTEQTHPGFAKD